MASVAAAVGAINSTANQLGTYSSAVAFTPVAGDLLVVVSSFSATTDNTLACTESAGGGTYTQVAMKEWNGTGSRMFVHIRDALIGASPVSRQIRLDLPADAATGCVAVVLRVTGMTKAGLTAMLQSAVAKNSASVPGITFGAACQTGNPVLCFYATSSANPPATTLPGSPFNSSFHSGGYSTPTNGGQVLKSDSGFTGTSITYGASDASAWGIIGIELDSSAGGSTVNGTAALSVPHSLVVVGTRTVLGIAASTPTDTLTVAGLRKVYGSGGTSLSDLLAVAGTRKVMGSAGLSAVDLLLVAGTVTGGGPATVFGTAALAAIDVLTVAGTRRVYATALLSSVDAMVVAGRRTVLGGSLASIPNALTVAGRRTVLGTSALSGQETLTIIGVRKVLGTSGLAVVDALTVQGRIVSVVVGTASLVSAGILTVDGAVAHIEQGTATITIGAILTARGESAPIGPRIVRGKPSSATSLTRTGFMYPMLDTRGETIYVVKQYITQVPYTRWAIDVHDVTWRVTDQGLLEPV